MNIYTVYGFSEGGGGGLLKFKGEYLDVACGSYFLGNGYRMYSSLLMRFYSADSLSPFGAGGYNAYAFVSGDPVNYGDPSGHVRAQPKIYNYRGKGKTINGVDVFRGPDPERPGKKITTIFAHGSPSGISMEIDGETLLVPAKRLIPMLEKEGIKLKGRRTHMAFCYSSTAHELFPGTSMAQMMANHAGKLSIGYKGSMPFNHSPPRIMPSKASGVQMEYFVQRVGENQREVLVPLSATGVRAIINRIRSFF
ncbi:RHS repeat-associated core domain-containing protein [Pseudomonas putida]|uniref:RHS repeat-associated core domain-containing protein n=1 Tax=Pseudomonas putida TaxID=303 RepID=UPI001E65479F|nr:RHS repeat-associated core domain-containing protein [Pseudomonas putida]